MMRAHRTARSVLLVLAALSLSACGIPTTGVVESGPPGTGIEPRALLYFMRNGSLVTVARDLGSTETGVSAAVHLLSRGPTPAERSAGLYSELPQFKVKPVIRTEGAEVSVVIADRTSQLNHHAVEQLVCTVARAGSRTDAGIRPLRVALVYPAVAHPGHSRSTHEADAACSRAPSAGFSWVPVQMSGSPHHVR